MLKTVRSKCVRRFLFMRIKGGVLIRGGQRQFFRISFVISGKLLIFAAGKHNENGFIMADVYEDFLA